MIVSPCRRWIGGSKGSAYGRLHDLHRSGELTGGYDSQIEAIREGYVAPPITTAQKMHTWSVANLPLRQLSNYSFE